MGSWGYGLLRERSAPSDASGVKALDAWKMLLSHERARPVGSNYKIAVQLVLLAGRIIYEGDDCGILVGRDIGNRYA